MTFHLTQEIRYSGVQFSKNNFQVCIVAQNNIRIFVCIYDEFPHFGVCQLLRWVNSSDIIDLSQLLI